MKEVMKLAALCVDMYKTIDHNRSLIFTDANLLPIFKNPSEHKVTAKHNPLASHLSKTLYH